MLEDIEAYWRMSIMLYVREGCLDILKDVWGCCRMSEHVGEGRRMLEVVKECWEL